MFLNMVYQYSLLCILFYIDMNVHVYINNFTRVFITAIFL